MSRHVENHVAAPSDFKLGQKLWRQSEHGVASWLLRLINHHSAVIAIGAGSGISKFYSTLLDYLLDLAYI